jgi:hypothetical protein
VHRSGRSVAIAAVGVALGACGGGGTGVALDATGPRGSFTIVGHANLGARGMNAGLAVVGDTVYVGSRIDDSIAGRDAGVLIVDVSDPAAPAVVGSIGAPDEGVTGMSSRELRAVPDLNLLIVLNLQCSPDLHGCSEAAGERESLKLYDITDRRAPVRVGAISFGTALRPQSPHEMFVWRDPDDPARVLVFLTLAPAPGVLAVVDVSDPTMPRQVMQWSPIANGGLVAEESSFLHSVSVSDDGRTGYFSHQQGGLFVADLSQVIDGAAAPVITIASAPGAQLDWSPPSPMGPHSAVRVPGRDVLVVTDEIYPEPFSAGCPYGWMRTVDIADPATPAVLGEFRVAENTGGCADAAPMTTFTAHNATVTHDVALVTWHSAGLQAIDVSDPAAPTSLAELRPEPLAEVAVEDPGLGGNPLTMWSYPVIQDGLIYVVDIRNGLYLLRYEGDFADELAAATFLEGNSNM